MKKQTLIKLIISIILILLLVLLIYIFNNKKDFYIEKDENLGSNVYI